MELAAGKVTRARPWTRPDRYTRPTSLRFAINCSPPMYRWQYFYPKLFDLHIIYFIRSSRWSPTRNALAIAVRAGFTALMLTKKLVSTTYRLSNSCALQLTSNTDVLGSLPKRQVPAWCATPA